MGSIVSFINQKGGVGKSTCTINIAAQIAKNGKKVLVVDFDPQGNTTSGVGISKNTVKKTVYDVIINDVAASDVIIKTEFSNLDVLPANISLAGAEVELQQILGREFKLRDALQNAKENYDYVFIDCPPTLGLLTVNALVASDGIIIPMQCEFFALEGLSQLMNSIKRVRQYYNNKLEISGILINMYNGRFVLTNQVVEELETHYGAKLFNTKITRAVKLSEAPGFGKPICYFAPYSTSALQFKKVSDEIMMRI